MDRCINYGALNLACQSMQDHAGEYDDGFCTECRADYDWRIAKAERLISWGHQYAE